MAGTVALVTSAVLMKLSW